MLLAAALTLIVMAGCAPSIPSSGAIRVNPTDGQRYIWIGAGDYQQGCSKFDEACEQDERPSHKVILSKGFWIGQTEVTVAAYRRFAAATRHAMPLEPTFGDHSLNPGWSDMDMPIVNTAWADAKFYCEWMGGRLPTESQWEYAARAGTTDAGSGQVAAISWFADNAGARAVNSVALQQDQGGYLFNLLRNGNTFHHVAMKAPNRLGVYDALGNVWEWTADWYAPDYYTFSSRSDPIGPTRGDARVLRGGSWVNAPNSIRLSVRGRRPPEMRSIDTGFRCAW